MQTKFGGGGVAGQKQPLTREPWELLNSITFPQVSSLNQAQQRKANSCFLRLSESQNSETNTAQRYTNTHTHIYTHTSVVPEDSSKDG